MIFDHNKNEVNDAKLAESILRQFSETFYASYSDFKGTTVFNGETWIIDSINSYNTWRMYKTYLCGITEVYTFNYETKELTYTSGLSHKIAVVNECHSQYSGYPAHYSYSPITETFKNKKHGYFGVVEGTEEWENLGFSEKLDEGDVALLRMKDENKVSKYIKG